TGIDATGAQMANPYETAFAPFTTTINNTSGVYSLNETLTVSSRGNSDVEIEYVWSRKIDGEYVAIEGATGATYQPTADAGDAGRALKVVATGVGASTGVQYEYEFAPETPATPELTGEYVDGTFTATWTPSEIALSYEVSVSTNGGDYELVQTTTESEYVLTGLVAGNDYAIQVVATNDAGSSAPGTISSSPLLASVDVNPYSFGATLTTTLQSENAQATYQWYRRVDGEYVAIEGATDAVYTPVAADAGHFLKVAVEGVGVSAGTSAEIVVRPNMPETPTGLAFGVYNPKTRSIELTWQDVADETSYIIRSSTNGTTYKTTSTAPGQDETSAVIKMANAGATLYYQVGARNDAGFSEYASIEYTPIGLELNKEAFVVGDELVATITPEADATLQWYYSDAKDGDWTAIEGATTNTLTIDDTLATFWVKIVATGVSGVYEGNISEEFAAPKALVAPTNLSVASYDADAKEITLGWDDNSNNETGFEIEFYVENVSRWISFLVVDEADATTGTRSASAAAVDYKYLIRSVNEYGYSDWTYTDNALVPLKITATPETYSGVGVVLTATATQGEAGGYQWYRRVDGEYYAIEGATSATYETIAVDAGHFIKVEATGVGVSDGTTSEAIVRPTAPATPEGLTFGVYNPKSRSIELKWNDVAD
ncbi:MAG: fibronectin type III domain-containing protein, partial [Thermoguttaceae bacterium]|nr:fibronectin type III domain-containing protein [Thermoguttaceae bacterium]